MPALLKIVGERPSRAAGTSVTVGFLGRRLRRDRPRALLGSRLTGWLSEQRWCVPSPPSSSWPAWPRRWGGVVAWVAMAAELERETTDLLSRLVAIDTVNPPGNERPAQELLAGLLEDAGFEVELLGRTEDRPNLLARRRGAVDGPTLCLLSHVDTVLADAGEWQRDPWSGEVFDGVLWGRGAQDMKSQTAAEVVGAIALAQAGGPARGELLIASVADEETGGSEGAMWLCEHHPDRVRCDLLLNEGAGTVIPFEGERVYGVCLAEKGVFRFTVTTDGVAGHASMPRIGENALLKMVPLLQAIGDGETAFDVTDPPRAMLAELGISVDGDPAAALSALEARDPVLAALVEPMLRVTLAPTRISASEKINVIPSRARLQVDCRTPPGMERDQVLARIHEVLGGGGYQVEFTEEVVGNSSPADTPLMDALRGWITREDPEARVVPTMLPAFTDSRTFRDAFPECVAYGFFPQREMTLYETAPLIHARDERIAVADLGFAARCYRDVAKELLA
jgi:acetylornithine deacetylase/succinyl-diaminopimelate desuccinylase-like protein